MYNCVTCVQPQLGQPVPVVLLTVQVKKVGHILDKTAELRINLNIDSAPIVSTSYIHPSQSQTSWNTYRKR